MCGEGNSECLGVNGGLESYVEGVELYLKGNGRLFEGFKHKRGLNRTTFCVVVKEDLS